MEARKSSDPNDWTDGATFFELAAEVESRAPLADSLDHGLNHWTLVAWTGAELLVTMPDADDFVVLLFALFHDSQRETDYVDPDHGARGAALATELVPAYLPDLEPSRLEKLTEACVLHTAAGPSDDPTMGPCWDSDRLNLWRVDIQPSPRYLSTAEAKNPKRIEWALDHQDVEYSWREIFARYQAAALGLGDPIEAAREQDPDGRFIWGEGDVRWIVPPRGSS